MVVANVTGWSELINGNVVSAAFTMFNGPDALRGWVIIILFAVFELMLLIKTRNLTLAFTTAIIFATAYVGTTNLVSESYQGMIVVAFIGIILGGIFYFWFKQ